VNNVAYLRVESLSSSEHNPFSPEDQTKFLGENAARLIDQEWNEYGPVVKVDVVAKCDSHSQAFTDMLAALEKLVGASYRCGEEQYEYDGVSPWERARAAIAAARKEMGE
jgi:hypothetical protein